MEDDEEVQSQPSEGTGSPASPRSNGRITVTVAAVPPPPNTNTLTLALPIQQQSKTSGGGASGGGGGGGGGGGREDCWSEGATAVLIEAWGERYLELSRGNLKQQHWKDVADVVSSRDDYTKPPKTDVQCKNRIDTVKKKYKLEKAKIAAGQGPSRWTFFERMDHLIGPTAKGAAAAGGGGGGPSSSNQKVPMGIPMGARSAPQLRQHQPPPLQKHKQALRRRPPVDSDSSESEPEPSPDSTDSSPPPTYEKKRPRIQQRVLMNSTLARPTMPRGGRDGGGTSGVGPTAATGGTESDRNWANSVRELTRAILKFGEAYEQAENAKLQQMVEMEKQRMKFAKELELQRMQFFMKTQLELSQLKNRRVGSSNHHSNNNTTTAANNNNTNSFSSN